MIHVWDGTEWNATKALKVWTGSAWNKTYKFKVRTSTAWIPVSTSDRDESVTVRWSVEAPTPPPPPPPVTHPVPDLDLLTLQEVEALLDPLNFTYSVTGYEVTSDNAKNNKVVVDSQNPAAGVLLAEGSNVVFKLYEFVQPTTTVPYIEGVLIGNADTAILNANLVVGNPLGTEETYDTNLIGKVIVGTVFPAPGTTVDVGESVIYDYYIQKPFATVPQLVDQDENNVFTILEAANLTPGTRTVFNTTNAALDGKVKSQFPLAGTQVQQDSLVNYQVNEHTLTVVPNIAGLSTQDANYLLQQNYLYPGTTTPEETFNQSLEGKVKTTQINPAPGTTVNKDTDVDYVYYVPNEYTTMPNVVGQNATTAFQNVSAAELVGVGIISYTRNLSEVNVVYHQEYGAGSQLPVGTLVDIFYKIEEIKFIAPDVRGLTPGTQGTQIANTNFTWGSKTLADTSTENVNLIGKIATQSPTQGALVYVDPINYGLYVDGRPTVPNVLGQTEANAKTAITNAGLNWTVSYQNQTYNGQAVAGTVANQAPSGGERAASGSTVLIIVWNAYIPTTTTYTASVSIGWNGDIPWEWQASYRDTIGASSSLTDGGIRTQTTIPWVQNQASQLQFYVGRFDTTNEKQHTVSQFDWVAFQNWVKANKTNNANFEVTAATLRVWAKSGVGGNDNAKSLRVGSYPSDTSSPPSTMTESAINTRGIVLPIASRGTYGYATANANLISDCFTAPNYPVVVYAPNTSIDNYIVNDSDIRWDITIQWTVTA
jgi:beta-lactam-binding protein with PASTA domain